MNSLDCLLLLLSISVFSLTRLYVDIGALPLNELHNFQILQFVHKCIYHHHKLPQMFSTYFTKNSMFHTYNTRTKEGLQIDFIRSSLDRDVLSIREVYYGTCRLVNYKKCSQLNHPELNLNNSVLILL